jgi:hypothetical protein
VNDNTTQKHAVAIVMVIAAALTVVLLGVEMISCGTVDLAACNFGTKL